MHPVFIFAVILSAVWFFVVGAMAQKGVGARVGLAVLGVLVFMVVAVVLGQVMENQDFFRDALRAGPDIGPITKFIVLPSVLVVFLSGLGLRKIFGPGTKASGEN